MSRLDRSWNNIQLDSDEEYLFLCWYEEAEELGLVSNLIRQPEYELSGRVSETRRFPSKKNPDRTVDRFLLHPHSYKADFLFDVKVEDDGRGNMIPSVSRVCDVRYQDGLIPYKGADDTYACVVDIKGGFANHRSRNSSDVTFPVNQKWVYDKYGILVNKVVISPRNGFFSRYWAPECAFTTAKGRPSIVYRSCRKVGDISA